MRNTTTEQDTYGTGDGHSSIVLTWNRLMIRRRAAQNAKIPRTRASLTWLPYVILGCIT